MCGCRISALFMEEFHLLMLDGGYSTDFFEIGNVTGRMKEKLDENLNQKNFDGSFRI